ncbi:MAG: discoidin domain-containing protein [Actinomycetota bacterium]
MRRRFLPVAALLALTATIAAPSSVSANDDADNDGIPDAVDSVANTGINVAREKATAQSSDYSGQFPSSKAVDGQTGGDYAAGFTHTNDDEPWWEVDLGRHHTINGLNIFNRTNCCGERLDGAVVMVGAHPYGEMSLDDARAASVWTTTIGIATELTQIAVPDRIARYVRVQLPSSGSNALQLAEVQVMGFQGRPNDADADFVIDAEDTIDNNGVIVSTDQLASQSSVSSTRPDAGPQSAVDGIRDGGRDGSYPIALTDDDEPWWEVDLGAWYSVDGINLANRTDAGSESLIVGAHVMVGAQPFGDVSFADALGQAAWSTAVTESTRRIQIDVPETVGRYVRIQLPPGEGSALGLGEVDVIASSDPQTGDLDNDGIANGSDLYVTGTNVARGKSTSQSSTLGGFVSGLAVDGITVNNTNQGFSHTLDASPWWDVDLGGNFTVDNINIFNRTDCCGHRLGDAEVMISVAPFGDLTIEQARARASWIGTVDSAPGAVVQFGVPDAIGRYVRVQLPDNGVNALQLTELQVSGVAYTGFIDESGDPAGDADGDTILNIDDTVVSGTNVALGKAATQSSNYNGTFVAGKAVDGKTGGGYADSFTHTLDDEPWWDVDLGADYTIDNINLFNRTNCCGARLTDAVVMISSQPFGEMPIADAIAQSGWTVTIESPTAVMQYEVPDVVGRYIRVQIPSGLANALSLAEVQVSGS